MTAAPSDHPVTVLLQARSRDDGLGEADLAGDQDEPDRVHRVPRDAAVEDDGVDLVLVREEDLTETLDRGRLDGADAVLVQRRLPVPDHVRQVVGDEDERR